MSETAAALKKILLEKSVRTGEFTLASGKTSDLYIDCRVTALDPDGAKPDGEEDEPFDVWRHRDRGP